MPPGAQAIGIETDSAEDQARLRRIGTLDVAEVRVGFVDPRIEDVVTDDSLALRARELGKKLELDDGSDRSFREIGWSLRGFVKPDDGILSTTGRQMDARRFVRGDRARGPREANLGHEICAAQVAARERDDLLIDEARPSMKARPRAIRDLQRIDGRRCRAREGVVDLREGRELFGIEVIAIAERALGRLETTCGCRFAQRQLRRRTQIARGR